MDMPQTLAHPRGEVLNGLSNGSKNVLSSSQGMRISFGPFAFDRQSRLLWREGAEVALPPRVLGVLELLIDRHGQVVARQDLMDAVWKDAFVTDTSLAEAVSFLRQALGDDPQSPRYIQTVHRRGYRFLAPVTPDAPRPDGGRGLTPGRAIEGADRGLTPDRGFEGADRGLTPDLGFAVASGDRAVPATVSPSIGWQLLPWSVAVFCTLLVAALAWRLITLPGPAAPPIARFEIRAADGSSFAAGDPRIPAIALSADGAVAAWSACDTASGACALYVRPVDRIDALRLSGTDGAAAPFFSPDGRWLGFFADGRLKKIAAAGGPPSVLADAPSPGGGAWRPDGQIVFAGTPAGGLSLVSDEGGAVTTLTTPDGARGELRHLLPSWLPGGGALVFTIATSPLAEAPGDLAVLSLRARTWKRLRGGVTRAMAPGSGYLLLASGRDLQAATFDERTLALTGSGESVLASITGRGGLSQFAVSPAGTLAAIEPAPAGRVAWSDRPDAGAGSIARLTSIAISPDGRAAAGVIADSHGADVWIADIASGALTRITYGGTNVSPAWSADGRRIYFAARTTGAFSLASRRLGDRAAAPVGAAMSNALPSSVATDGTIAATLVQPEAAGRTRVALVPPDGGPPRVLTDGPFDEASPVFSPDGRWLALESNESGRTEIVVRDLRGGRRAAVSTDGGAHPVWSGDGRAIYFVAGRRVMRVPFDPARGPVARGAEALLDRPATRVLAIAPDGRALVQEQPPASSAIVVLQWLRELRQRLPLPVTAPR
jgi:serine/threonine-protein kinase